MLEIKNLAVNVGEKEILHDISLIFEESKTYFVLGKNGSGKSSLAFTIAGHPKYDLKRGQILVDGEDITSDSPNSRSENGIFLSFQNVPEIPGLVLEEYLRTIYSGHLKKLDPQSKGVTPFIFRRFLRPLLEELNIPEEFLARELNVGFSGGEKRKIELLQIRLLDPKYIILDEIDSGLDIDAFKIVAKSLTNLKSGNKTLIFITHNFNLADYADIDRVFIIDGGKVVASGGRELIEKIEKYGYCAYCPSEGQCRIVDGDC